MAMVPVPVRILFANLQDKTQAICPGKVTIAGFDTEAEVGTNIKTFKMCVYSGIYHIQSPKQDEDQGWIINVTTKLVSVKLEL